jgi:hypothetical protein
MTPADIQAKIDEAELRSVAVVKAITGQHMTVNERAIALQHYAKLSNVGPLTDDEWYTVTDSLAACALPADEVQLRFRELAFALHDCDDDAVELATARLLTVRP